MQFSIGKMACAASNASPRAALSRWRVLLVNAGISLRTLTHENNGLRWLCVSKTSSALMRDEVGYRFRSLIDADEVFSIRPSAPQAPL